MKIYIDEAGSFIPPQGKRKFSLVLALVVPAATEAALFYEFLRLRDGWPEKGVEIKGSKLNETQTAEVLNLLAGHEAIAEFQAIDMTVHTNDVIGEFKERQAAALTANLTPAHAEAVVRRLKEDGDAIRTLSNPLFVQAFLTIELILELLNVAINYFAQRHPDELGRFAWMIDRKDRTVTQMEQLWSTLILPFGEPRSAQYPYPKVDGFDYSHFAKFEIDEDTADEKTRRHLQWMRENLPSSKPLPPKLRCLNASRIWSEERSFEDSQNNLGLQLADIAATTLCRALNGNLQQAGWEPLSRLLIRKKAAPLFRIGKSAGGQHPSLEPHAATVWRILDGKGLSMMREPA